MNEREFHENMPKKLKSYLHKIEEQPGAPKSFLKLIGSKWIIAIIEHFQEQNKEKASIIHYYQKENERLRKLLNGHKPYRNPISSSLRHEVFKRDNYRCVECGITNKETTLHVDHIIPVSQGGSDTLDNYQTLCEECNLAKGNRAWKGGNSDG